MFNFLQHVAWTFTVVKLSDVIVNHDARIFRYDISCSI